MRKCQPQKAVLFRDGALSWKDCAWSLFRSPMDAKNFVAKFKTSSAERQPRPAHRCWTVGGKIWTGMCLLASTATWYKVAKQFRARVATYTYSYMRRCHLRSHANWLAEIVSVAWDRIWWGEAMTILHQGSPRLNNSAWPYFRFVKYYHLPRSMGIIGHSSFNPCEVFLPMLCPCIFTMACA